MCNIGCYRIIKLTLLLSKYASLLSVSEVSVIYTEQNYKRPMWHFETFIIALGVAKYIKSYKINFVVQYATNYCPLEHDSYKTISAHLGSPISFYINNLHGAFIFLLSVSWCIISSEVFFVWITTSFHPVRFRTNIKTYNTKTCSSLSSFSQKCKKLLFLWLHWKLNGSNERRV